MTSPGPLCPLILRLPNEVLRNILSYVYNLSCDEPFVQYTLDGEEHEISQMLVLGSVCCHFRAITAQLDFWCDPNFCFADLIPRSPLAGSVDGYYDGQLLAALFSDWNLVNSLGQRKKDWIFESYEGLMVVLEGVPLFRQNTRAIHLEIIEEEDCHAAMKALAAYSHITKFSTHYTTTIDLSAIAALFPSLESLSCFETGNFKGSLEQLPHLHMLRLSSWDNTMHPNRPCLPLQSSQTLTELSLQYCMDVNIPFFDTDSLSAFMNLKSLAIRPLTESICEFIIRAQIQLYFFEITIVERHAPIYRFVDMIQADCLRNLKEFGIAHFGHYKKVTEQYWFRVFDTFTSTLSSVEQLQLNTPLRLEWCQYFARMSNLKILNW